MKTRFLVLTFFVISLAFVLCGAGCVNVADSSAGSYDSGNSTGGGYTPPQIDNIVCYHVDEDGKSICTYEHIGTKPNPAANNEIWHYHRAICNFCGSETTGWCTTSSYCNECNLRPASQNNSGYDSYDNTAQFIEIKENINTIVIVANNRFRGTQPLTNYINNRKTKYDIIEKYYPTGTTAETIREELKTIYQEQKRENKNMCVLLVGRGGGEYQQYGIPEFVNKNQWQGKRQRQIFGMGIMAMELLIYFQM